MGISIEAQRVINRLQKLETADYGLLTKEIASYISTDLRANFRREIDPSGRKWAPLSKRTIAEKQELGFGSQPILVRTGNLRSSIRSRKKRVGGHKYSQDQYEVGSEGVPYAEKHQRGDAKEKLPARPFIGITSKSESAMRGLVQKFIRKILYT